LAWQAFSQLAPLQQTPFSQASSPLHSTAQPGPVQTTPAAHAVSPLQVTLQLVASLQSTPPAQLPDPVHLTTQVTPGGHTIWLAQVAPLQVIEQTPPTQVPPAAAHGAVQLSTDPSAALGEASASPPPRPASARLSGAPGAAGPAASGSLGVSSKGRPPESKRQPPAMKATSATSGKSARGRCDEVRVFTGAKGCKPRTRAPLHDFAYLRRFDLSHCRPLSRRCTRHAG
jgi:hypothetical protein